MREIKFSRPKYVLKLPSFERTFQIVFRHINSSFKELSTYQYESVAMLPMG